MEGMVSGMCTKVMEAIQAEKMQLYSSLKSADEAPRAVSKEDVHDKIFLSFSTFLHSYIFLVLCVYVSGVDARW